MARVGGVVSPCSSGVMPGSLAGILVSMPAVNKITDRESRVTYIAYTQRPRSRRKMGGESKVAGERPLNQGRSRGRGQHSVP
jgi:hypothetical protein